MKRLLGSVAIALALTACHDSLTAPPSGLPVALYFLGASTPATSIGGMGDSATVTLPSSALAMPFCWDVRSDAGIEGGMLVVTITSTETDRVCILTPTPAYLGTRIVVHQVPPGRYELVLVERLAPRSGRASKNEVARGPISLPWPPD
jgi:hypothetical protein